MTISVQERSAPSLLALPDSVRAAAERALDLVSSTYSRAALAAAVVGAFPNQALLPELERVRELAPSAQESARLHLPVCPAADRAAPRVSVSILEHVALLESARPCHCLPDARALAHWFVTPSITLGMDSPAKAFKNLSGPRTRVVELAQFLLTGHGELPWGCFDVASLASVRPRSRTPIHLALWELTRDLLGALLPSLSPGLLAAILTEGGNDWTGFITSWEERTLAALRGELTPIELPEGPNELVLVRLRDSSPALGLLATWAHAGVFPSHVSHEFNLVCVLPAGIRPLVRSKISEWAPAPQIEITPQVRHLAMELYASELDRAFAAGSRSGCMGLAECFTTASAAVRSR